MAEEIIPMEHLPAFVDGSDYLIKIHSSVEIFPGTWVRPDSPRIIVNAEIARNLGDVVIWAQKVE